MTVLLDVNSLAWKSDTVSGCPPALIQVNKLARAILCCGEW
jgi:hypothetical protein